MNTTASVATTQGIDPAMLADLDRAAAAHSEIFSAADLPAGAMQSPSAPQPVADAAVAGMISGGLVVTFNLLAKQRGAHWALDADTANEAGTAYALVIQKYFPAFQGGPEFTALLITVALIAPRVMMDKANAALEAEKAQGASDGAQPE